MLERSIENDHKYPAQEEDEPGFIREWPSWSIAFAIGAAVASGIYIGILKCIFGDDAPISYIIYF